MVSIRGPTAAAQVLFLHLMPEPIERLRPQLEAPARVLCLLCHRCSLAPCAAQLGTPPCTCAHQLHCAGGNGTGRTGGDSELPPAGGAGACMCCGARAAETACAMLQVHAKDRLCPAIVCRHSDGTPPQGYVTEVGPATALALGVRPTDMRPFVLQKMAKLDVAETVKVGLVGVIICSS